MTTATATRTIEIVLTTRQREVLAHLAEGRTMEITALRLGISTRTVKFHVLELYRRLDAVNAAHAVAIGFRRGMLA